MILLTGNETNYKSTIANKLSSKLGWEIVRGSSFELAQCTQDELFQHFMKIAVGRNNVVVDRFIWCNLTYAYLYNNYAMIRKEQQQAIESILELKKAKIIYLHAPAEVLKSRLRSRGDEYVEENMLVAINKRYEEVFKSTKLKHISIDTSLHTSDKIVDIILNLPE